MIFLLNNKEKYLEFITDDNQILIMRNLLDKIENVMINHIIETTSFFDPYQRRLSTSILNRFLDISYTEEGGISNAERKVLILYPDYMYMDNTENYITSLAIEGSFDKLCHKDFLGALLGLGINRDKIGDILIHNDLVQIVVKKEVGEYILYNLKKVGKQNVEVKEISKDELEPSKLDFEEKYVTLSSNRIDSSISSAYNLSRNDSSSLIHKDRVKLNWEPINKSSMEVFEGDIISVRGYGRFIIESFEGISKKGRIKTIIRILK